MSSCTATRLALGFGSLDVGAVVDTLRALGNAGWLTMEHEQAPGSRSAARRSARVLELAGVRSTVRQLPGLA